jgi:Na+/H+-dicarboxylate symporter/ABC-type amino acid transport substrate-binding protein
MAFLKKLSLTTRILIGAFSGIFLGLFFGDKVAWMSVLGDVFIGLLQMTVLPYIMFSLMVNIGRLSLESGIRLIKYSIIFLLLLLGLGLIYLMILPLAFPLWESGSFYDMNFIKEAIPLDFVKLYIPSNPFESMSNSVVPAIVLFSIFIGLGLMKLPNKETLLKPLDVVIAALNEINKMIVKVTPIGIFFIAAGIISELSWADLSRLQAYLLIYLIATLLFTFIVLPFLISIFTPYSSKTVFKITKSTLITIFATGKIIVVFPQLIENVKEIIASEKGLGKEVESEVDILMPLAYPFPNLGTFMIFIFVPFAAWFTGNALSWSDYPTFLGSTFLSSFVAPITGLPFSLDLLNIPAESFQLFVVSTVLTDRIRVVLGAFHLITLTILAISASVGILKFKKSKFFVALIVMVVSLFISVLGLRFLLKESIKNIPTNKERIDSFELISPKQESVELEFPAKNPTIKRRNENTLARIKRRGKIRIGLYENTMPFVFKNSKDNLVGYSVDLAYQLASDLGVGIEFVPVSRGKLETQLKKDYFDIVMSDIFISSSYAELVGLSKTYQDVSLALIVPKNQKEFDTFDNLIKLDTFNISYFVRREIAEKYLSNFPNGGAIEIKEFDEFFIQKNDSLKIDAHLTSAERASVLTIYYPEYKAVNPLPFHIKNGLVFPIANDEVWKRYIDNWIDYRTADGTIESIYNQWILGQRFNKKEYSWSIYEDVLLN